MGKYIGFDLGLSFHDIQEDFVSVSEYNFQHFPNSWIFLKSHFSISCCIATFSFLFFLYFPHFSLKMVLIVSNCAYFLFLFCCKIMFLASYCSPCFAHPYSSPYLCLGLLGVNEMKYPQFLIHCVSPLVLAKNKKNCFCKNLRIIDVD